MTLSTRELEQVEQNEFEFNEYDKTDDVALDIVGIMDAIPHRYPFLFLDYIKTLGDEEIVAIKNITFNEPVFRGYRPDYAVLPSSIQAEILAQAGCAGILSKPENKGKIGYFMSIGEAEYFAPIRPGDQLICKVQLKGSSSRFGKASAEILVGDKVMSKCELTFALVDA
jgi:3-hydroxyacyl-[acyl-carrier-protein] dehydratase